MRLVSLKYDYAFHELFSHEGIRKQFISDVTGIPLEKIKSVRLDNPFLWKRYRMQKQGILDVAVILNDDTRIDIELQIQMQKYWAKRNLFYLAKLYTDDLRIGEDYRRLRKCITISILDFQLIEGEEYHNIYTLRDKKGREFTDLFEVHIIELNKKLKGSEAVNDWIRLFNAESMEDLEMIKTQNAGILQAMEVVREMSFGRKLRLTYEAHLKAVRDRKAQDEYIRDLGLAEGEVLGEIRGKAEGKAETLLLILESKGKVSENLRARILAESNPEKLDQWVKQSLSCVSIEEFASILE